jgi:hypothetical protein
MSEDLTLWFQPQKRPDLGLACEPGFGPTFTLTRTTTATYVNQSRQIATAAAGQERIEYDPVTGECLGLLIEEARTNICLQSEDFGTTWANQGPDGTTTADRLIDDSSTGTGNVIVGQSITISTSTVYTVSVFAKADQLDWFRLQIAGMGALDTAAYFDLTNGAVGATTGANNTSEFIEDYGNGWYRCGITFTSDAADANVVIYIWAADDNNDIAVDLDGTSSILVWGAQLEAGAFPTSYIPTTTGSVARNADDVTTADVTWLTSGTGTLYTDAARIAATGVSGTVVELNDGSSVERINIIADDSYSQLYMQDASTQQANLQNTGSPYTAGTRVRTATAYATNDVEHYADGSRTDTGDQVAVMPTDITTLDVGSRSTSDPFNGHIKELRYYNYRKPNVRLQEESEGGIAHAPYR